jgi:hypothetical protein
VPILKNWVGIPALVLLLAGCTVLGIPVCGNGKLNLSNGNLNPKEFICPSLAKDYSYDIKGTLDADNQTRNKITVKSMSTAAVVQKLAGSWAVSVGDKSSAENIEFSPKTIESGQKTTFTFTTPWSCTNDGNNTQETYADFKIQLVIDTDHGKYTVDLPSHRMRMAGG